MTNKSPGRGRRPGQSETRQRILEVARAQFLADGFHAVTLRRIAAEAGVDAALPSYFFGSKQGLFGAALSLTLDPATIVAEVLTGDLDGLGVRLLAGVLAAWDAPDSGGPLRTAARTALADPGYARLVREALGHSVIDKVAARLEGPDAAVRAAGIGTIVSGVIFSRYLLELEPMASLPAEDVVAMLAPSLQRFVDGTS